MAQAPTLHVAVAWASWHGVHVPGTPHEVCGWSIETHPVQHDLVPVAQGGPGKVVHTTGGGEGSSDASELRPPSPLPPPSPPDCASSPTEPSLPLPSPPSGAMLVSGLKTSSTTDESTSLATSAIEVSSTAPSTAGPSAPVASPGDVPSPAPEPSCCETASTGTAPSSPHSDVPEAQSEPDPLEVEQLVAHTMSPPATRALANCTTRPGRCIVEGGCHKRRVHSRVVQPDENCVQSSICNLSPGRQVVYGAPAICGCSGPKDLSGLVGGYVTRWRWPPQRLPDVGSVTAERVSAGVPAADGCIAR